MLEIGYGHTVSSLDDDKFIKLVENGVRKCLLGSGAGATLVDFFPIRAYIILGLPPLELNLLSTIWLQFVICLHGCRAWISSDRQSLHARQ